MKSLTNEQSKILIQLIEANWDSDNLESYIERDKARQLYYNLKRQLVESMGLDEWIEFMNTGAKMFAPSQS
jgi:hypothetical protein